jgi:hypothetical protein
VSNPLSREEHIISEEPTITDLGVKDLGPNNPLITDLSTPVVVQVYPYEHLEVSQKKMEPNPWTAMQAQPQNPWTAMQAQPPLSFYES